MVAKGWCLGVFPRERQEQAAARLRAVAREQRREPSPVTIFFLFLNQISLKAGKTVSQTVF